MQVVLGLALWLMLFYSAATVLFLSRRDEEDLLQVRLRGLYDRLADWLKVQSFVTDNDHVSNGSRAPAGPRDSQTATLIIVDEADLVPDLAMHLGLPPPGRSA